MNPIVLKYPLDTTGRNPNNLVVGEIHDIGVVTPTRRNRVIVPIYGPYFTEGLRIRVRSTGQYLQPRTQYVCTEFYQAATKRTGLEVCAAIVITDTLVPSDLEIQYQVVGGEFSLPTSVLQEAINNLDIDTRPVKWGDIIGLPDAFPPSDHLHDLGDIYGFEYLIPPLEAITQAILTGSGAMEDAIKAWVRTQIEDMDARLDIVRDNFNEHVDDRDNPHDVNKAQVGLAFVENFALPSTTEATAGTSNSHYMTPLRTREAIKAILNVDLKAHTDRTDNPHNVSKSQVGLSLVPNYSVSTQIEAQDGTVNNRFMTPLRTKEAIDQQVGNAFREHANNQLNPHKVTKGQVGLGLVQNYPIATEQEAIEGTRDDRYMTPLLVRYIVEKITGDLSGGHITNYSNPHRVTKAQVGLGNVDDFATATQQQAEAGSLNNLFMTPLRVKQAIAANVGDIMSGHTGDFNNPHKVTKSQVGLGLVDNYQTANATEAQDGTRNDRFMTPLRTKNAIDKYAADVVSPHINDLNNPHKVTKAQVDLGNVQNYDVATAVEAQAAGRLDAVVVNNKYLTPLRLADALRVFQSDYINSHTDDLTNPHQVTKAQVGLGSVQDYAIASQAEALAGSLNTRYMTPLRTKELINQDLGAHTSDQNNPHNVTAAQIGAVTRQELDSALDGKLDVGDISGRAGDAMYAAPGESVSGLVGDRILSRLLIATDDAELTDMLTKSVSWKDVLDTWERPSILGDDVVDAAPADTRAWAYNETTDRVKSTVASTSLTGFIDHDTYGDYVIDAVLDADDVQKGLIGLALGYQRDDRTGQLDTLTVTRTPGGAMGFAGGLATRNVSAGDTTTPMALLGVQTNLAQTSATLVASSNKLKWGDNTVNETRRLTAGDLAGNTGWKYQRGGVRVKVTRVGDIITVETSDFIFDSTGSAAPPDMSTVAFVAAAKLTIDLAANPELDKFRGPQRIGFVNYGQNGVTFSSFSRPGSKAAVVDPRDGTVREWVGNAWVVSSELTTKDVIKPGRLYTNPHTGRLFFGEGDGLFQEVNVGAGANAAIEEMADVLTDSFNEAAALLV